MPILVLSGALGVFRVPRFVPHAQPVSFASYSLGFSNLVASLAFATLLTALFVRAMVNSSSRKSLREEALAGALFWSIQAKRRKPYCTGITVVTHIRRNFSGIGRFRQFEVWRRYG